MSKNRKATADVINLEDHRWKKWLQKETAITQEEELADRRRRNKPPGDPWQSALAAIEMRFRLNDEGRIQPFKDGLDRARWGNWLDQIKSGQSPAPPETDDAKLKRLSALVMDLIPAKGKHPKARNAKSKRKSTTTIERDRAWLVEFESGDWDCDAAFALTKNMKPPAMRAALNRARADRQQEERKSSRRK